jgi:hypothetical protein
MGVFVAIRVTAPMVPRTFEAGAVDLLMSKPVSRSLLFISKFIGGCAFILLNAGYFILGLWLIVGLRFDIWSSKLLLCIPIFLFLFSVYYCVSTLAGVWWKNAIVSVVVTIIFWLVCFVIGTSKTVIEQFFLHPQRIVKLTRAGDSLIGVNQSGQFVEWQSADRRWDQILKSQIPGGPGFGPVIVGPLYDDAKKELTFIEQPPAIGRFDFFGPQATLVTATWSGSWQRENGPLPPGGTSWLFRGPRGDKIIVAAEGVFHWDESAAAKGPELLGVRLPFGGKPFVPIGPRLSLAPPVAAAMDGQSGDVAIFSNQTLTFLKRVDDGKYTLEKTRSFDDFSGPAVLAMADKKILLGSAEGDLQLLDTSKDLQTLEKFQPFGTSEPFIATAADKGSYFAVLFHSGRLWLLNSQSNKTRTLGRDVSGVMFDGPDRMLVADRGTRVTRSRKTAPQASGRVDPD